MSEHVCARCGKPADVEIKPLFHPLTARGERAWETINKAGLLGHHVYVCIGCAIKAGQVLSDVEDDG